MHIIVDPYQRAQNYANYRPRYPQRLIDDLRERTVGDRGQRLVDWGTGTGELALRLSAYFDEVTAVDISSAMVSVAQANARRERIENVEWQVGRAEALEIKPQSCDLIVAASAFHWMDRELLANRAFRGLKPSGALALVGGGGGGGVRKGTAEWHRQVAECVRKYTRDKAIGQPARSAVQGPHQDFLTPVGFRVESFSYPTEFSWQVDELIGYLYSIAFPSLNALGHNRKSFEHELRKTLACINPSGIIHETLDFYLTVARRPRCESEHSSSCR